MTFEPDVIYHAYADGTTYRLSPNPDSPPGTGYRDGAVLEWSDDPRGEWHGHFPIGPDALRPLAKALSRAAEDTE